MPSPFGIGQNQGRGSSTVVVKLGCYDKHGNVIGYVEAKVGGSFSTGQARDYIDFPPTKQTSALLILAPQQSLRGLVKHAYEHCSPHTVPPRLKPDHGVYTVKLPSRNRYLLGVTWLDLIWAMRQSIMNRPTRCPNEVEDFFTLYWFMREQLKQTGFSL